MLTNHDCMNNVLLAIEFFLGKEDYAESINVEETFKFLLEITDDGFTALENVMINSTNTHIASLAQHIIETYLDNESPYKM